MRCLKIISSLTLLLISFSLLGQKNFAELYIPIEFKGIDFGSEQKSLIEKGFDKFDSERIPIEKNLKLKTNLLYQLLTPDQLDKFNRDKEQYFKQYCNAQYSYLDLSPKQLNEIVAMYLIIPVDKNPLERERLIDKDLNNILNKNQRKIRAERWKETKSNQYKNSDHFANQLKNEIEKIESLKSYYIPQLSMLSAEFKDGISKVDLKKVKEMKSFYFKELKVKKKNKSKYFEKIGINKSHPARAYFENRFNELKSVPNICIFWCISDFDYNYKNLEEVFHFYEQLYYFKDTYPDLIENILKRKNAALAKMKEAQLGEDKDHENKKHSKETTLTITAPEYIQGISEIADFILYKGN